MSNARITRRDYTATTRLWGLCGCGCKWQWNGKTEDVSDGLWAIEHSACFCAGEAWAR